MTAVLVILAFVLLSLRPLTDDTRTVSDLRKRARRAGWLGCLLGTLKVALVSALLVLNDACRLTLHIVQGVRVVLGAMTGAVLHAPRPAVGGAR